jgi:hypothetical protein
MIFWVIFRNVLGDPGDFLILEIVWMILQEQTWI